MSYTLYAKQTIHGLVTAMLVAAAVRSTYGVAATSITNTVASGTEIHCTLAAGGASNFDIVSAPAAVSFTLSGNITVNARARETNASANTTLRVKIYKRDTSGTETLIGSGDFGSELTTTDLAKNWTITPTSTVINVGDRIVAKFYLINVGTMGSSQTGRISYGGNTSGAAGDTYIQLTETPTIEIEPEYLQGTSHGLNSCGFDNTCTSGSTIFAFFLMNSTTDTITSVSDDAGQSYTLVQGPITGSDRIYMYKKENNTSTTAVTVTATAGSGGVFETFIFEFSGVQSASVDTSSSGHGTGVSNPNAGTLTTSVANTMIVGMLDYNTGTPTPGTNFTFTGAESPNIGTGELEYKNVRAISSYPVTWTLAGSPNWNSISVALKGVTQPSSGTAVNTTDTAATSDTAARALIAVRSSSDSAAATDTAARGGSVWTRSASDTLTVSTTQVGATVHVRAATDSASATDAAARALAAARPTTDSAAATDTAARAGSIYIRTASDAAAAGDSAARALVLVRISSDTISVSDAAVRALIASRPTTDSAAATDTAGRVGSTYGRSASDTAGPTDAADGAKVSNRAATDSASATDAATGNKAAVRSATDNAVASDAANRAGSAYARAATDAATPADAASGFKGKVGSTSDSASATDTASRAGSVWVRSATEILSIADTAAALHIARSNTADAISIADAAGRLVTFWRPTTDTVATTDTAVGHVIHAGGSGLLLRRRRMAA